MPETDEPLPLPDRDEEGRQYPSLDIAASAIPNSLFDSPVVGVGGARRQKVARYVLEALRAAGRLLPEGGETRTEKWFSSDRMIAHREVRTFPDKSVLTGPWVWVGDE